MTLSHDEGACLPADPPCGFHQLTGSRVQLLLYANGHEEWEGASVKSLNQSVWEIPTLQVINGDRGPHRVSLWVSGYSSIQ